VYHTELIAAFAGAIQERATAILLANKDALLARPPTIRIPLPEGIESQAQLTGNPLCFRQVQAYLVTAAALTAP
jgi:hypothetical protein